MRRSAAGSPGRGSPTTPPRGGPGGKSPLSPAAPAHTFYIHPTTYLAGDRWNAPLEPEPRHRLPHPAVRADPGQRLRRCVGGLGAALSPGGLRRLPAQQRGCRPRRSASLMPTLRRPSTISSAQVPEGEPIILAGHSQGALHLMRLLEERKADLAGGSPPLMSSAGRSAAPPTWRRSGCPPARRRRRRAASCRG